jgi:hypothetical protein
MRSLACVVALLAAPGTSCGPGVSGPQPAAPRGQRALPWWPDPGGHWRWTMVTEEPGVRRIEVERWHIEPEGRALAGTLARTVTVLSTDGVPFTCNQALAYRLEAVYRLEGDRDAQGFRLREIDHHTLPSPCDDGRRTRLAYRGRQVQDTLALTWDGGSQTLQRVPGPDGAGRAGDGGPAGDGRARDAGGVRPGVPAAAAGGPARAGDAALAGAWRWQSREIRADTGEVWIEIEDWALAEDPAGQITGTVTQTVTVFDRDGRVFGCSGDTFYRYRDRYTLAGQRGGDALTVREVAVAPEDHPCVHGARRHLDTATGAVVGAHVVLTWRGERRQVLHRP